MTRFRTMKKVIELFAIRLIDAKKKIKLYGEFHSLSCKDKGE
jgi:hypothetical protein